MKILFIGCVESSAILLKTLLSQNKKICGIVTKQSSPFNADFVDLKNIAIEYNIPYFYYLKDGDVDMNNFIRGYNPDLIYCFGWSHLLHKDTLKLPRIAAIGFHPAALPQNRGRHPLIWALVLGLQETASTFFYMDRNADDGDILSQEFIKINNDDTAKTLYDKIIDIAKKQVVKFTEDFENNCVDRKKQDMSKVNNWRKRTQKDGCIDFRMGAQTIYDLVKALTKPYVGAHFVYKEKEYKVWNSVVVLKDVEFYKNIEFGKIVEVYSPKSFLVKTGNGLLKILECDEINMKPGDYL
ncbi:formyl transferase [Spirochaetia bacterium]|nr:formyl transferase [Spirochaetia bacterium]